MFAQVMLRVQLWCGNLALPIPSYIFRLPYFFGALAVSGRLTIVFVLIQIFGNVANVYGAKHLVGAIINCSYVCRTQEDKPRNGWAKLSLPIKSHVEKIGIFEILSFITKKIRPSEHVKGA